MDFSTLVAAPSTLSRVEADALLVVIPAGDLPEGLDLVHGTSPAPAPVEREPLRALRLRGFTPTVLHLGPLTRLGARATRANIAFDDHPDNKRWNDRIETVSADSVFDWLAAASLAGAVQELR